MIFLLPPSRSLVLCFLPALLCLGRLAAQKEERRREEEGKAAELPRVKAAVCLRSVPKHPQRWCFNLSVIFSRNTKL